MKKKSNPFLTPIFSTRAIDLSAFKVRRKEHAVPQRIRRLEWRENQRFHIERGCRPNFCERFRPWLLGSKTEKPLYEHLLLG